MITYKIKKGTTNVSVVCRAVDDTDGTPETAFDHSAAGIDLKYRREGAANADITEAALAALTAAHTDGGVEQIGNGYFRLDLPDAACAAGVDGVMVHGVATGMVIIGCYLQLVDYDPFNSTVWDSFDNQFDGVTGLVGDSYPASQDQVSSLAATPGVGARPFVPTTITVTAGTNEAGSADDLANDDSLLYTVDDAAGTITLDFDYQLDPDTEVIQYLLVAAAQGNTDDIAFQVYNQVGAAYVTFETIVGSNSLIYANLDKVIIQKYTSDTGLFQTRLTGTGLTGATLTVNKAVAYGQATSTGIKNGSTITLTESAANQNFVGNNWILELESQILDNMYSQGGAVSGEGIVNSGHAHFNHMEVGPVNVGPSHFDTCGFGSMFKMRTAGDYEMINCHTDTPAAGNITIDGNSLGAATSLINQDFKGSITFINLTAFHTMTISGTELGNIVLGGADATVKIRGIYESLTNNLTGSPTVTVQAIKASDIADILDDTGTSGVLLDAAATSAQQDAIGANVDIAIEGIIIGAAVTGTLSATQATSNLTGYTDDQLIGRIITVTSGNVEGESSDITDYANINGVLTFTAMTLPMANNDTFKIT